MTATQALVEKLPPRNHVFVCHCMDPGGGLMELVGAVEACGVEV